MIGRLHKSAGIWGLTAVMLALVGCEGTNPHEVPYRELGRELAGVYNPATSTTPDLNMRLVLGTRHTVTGRYDTPSGEVRFEGTWRRQGNTLIVSLPAQDGLPPEITLNITREKILTKIEPSPFSFTPETAPDQFIEQDIMRLTGAAVVAGIGTQLNLIRVITDVTGGGSGGPTQA